METNVLMSDEELLSRIQNSVRIVLVETSHPGNIGAVARAMKNMGLSKLVLVQPKEFPSEVATSRASGADALLENAKVFSTLNEAIEDCHLIVGASARNRSMSWPELNPRQCAQLISNLAVKDVKGPMDRVALVFGPESTGLTNEDLQRCHYHVTIPANPEYSSLNLAMAVQILTYELRMAYLQIGEEFSESTRSSEDPKITAGELEQMLDHMEQALVDIGFHDPDNPRQLMTRLRRLYQRSHLDKMELNIIRGILKATQKAARK